MSTQMQNELTPYEQGFMSKCAELGVDPVALLKQAAKKMTVEQLVSIFNNPKLLGRLRNVRRYSGTNPSKTLEEFASRLWDAGTKATAAANKQRREAGFFGRLFHRGALSRAAEEGQKLHDRSRALQRLAATLPTYSATPQEVLCNVEQLGALAKLRDGIEAGIKPNHVLHNMSLGHANYPSYSMLDLDVVRGLQKSRPDLFGTSPALVEQLGDIQKTFGKA